MPRKLNVWLLIWLVLGLLVLTGALILAHEIQMQRHAGAWLYQAERAKAKGKLERAAYYYRYYLGYRPDDTKALTDLAKTLHQTADSPERSYKALLVIEQALRRQPDATALRKDAMYLAMEIAMFDNALHHGKILLQSSPDATLWQDVGLCQEALERYNDAETSYRKAISLKPDLLMAYVQLAIVLRYHLERPQEALEVYNDMVRANPTNHLPLMARSQYLQHLGMVEDSEKDVAAAFALAPTNVGVAWTYARMKHARGEPDAAREVLKAAIEKHPKNVKLYQAVAALELRERRHQTAITWLQKGQKHIDEPKDLQVLLTDLLVSHGKSDQARTALRQLQKQHGPPEIAACLQARLWMIEGKWLPALDVLEQNRAKLAKHPYWSAHAAFLLGTAYRNLGDVEQALLHHRRAVKLAPSWTAARFGLGAALLQANLAHEALIHLKHSIDAEDAQAESHVLFARALLLKTLHLPKEKRHWSTVEQALTLAEKYNGVSADIVLMRAEVLAVQNNVKAAEDMLTKALAQPARQKNAHLWGALSKLKWYHGGQAGARQVLQDAGKTCGDSVALRLAWLHFWTRAGGREARDRLPDLEKGLEAFPRLEQLKLRRALASVSRNLGETKAAVRLWHHIAAAYPHDVESRLALFEVAVADYDQPSAQKIVEQIQTIEGKQGVLWRYGEAVLIATFVAPRDKARWHRAHELVQQIKKTLPDWGRAALLEGWLEDRAGRPDDAIEHYFRAVELGEMPSEKILTRMVRLLLKQKAPLKAALILTKVAEQQVLSKDLKRMAVELAFRHNNPQRAVRLAKQIVPAEARDHHDHLWLAGILYRVRQPGEAETILRRTLQNFPHVPEVWVRLAQHLKRTGHDARAKAFLQEVRTGAPPDHRQVILARCYEALGEVAAARAVLETHAAKHAQDFMAWKYLSEFYLRQHEFTKAEPLLRKLMHPKHAVPGELASRARRQLALTLATQPGPKAFKQALALLPSGANAILARDDAIARALILATRKQHQDEAQKLLETAAHGQPLSATENLALAELYQRKANHDKAVDLFQHLVITEGEKPAYLVPYIRSLLAQRDLLSTQYYLDRLIETDANHPALPRLRGHLRKLEESLAADAP